MNEDDPRHGKYAGYNAGCRETCCRRAAADYQRQRYFDRAVLGMPPRNVPKIGSVRRIQALQRLGWSAEYLSTRLGFSRAYLNVALNRDARRGINRATAGRITKLYDELSMVIGPSDISRRRAERNGWPPPLAWDDIDDPNERPHVGRNPGTYRAADLLAEWDHLRCAGVSIHTAAGQLGVTVGAIEKAIERAGKGSAA